MTQNLFEITTSSGALSLWFALILLVILIVSFRSRAVVFCQYLQRMTGIRLSPREVHDLYAQKGPEGVRELFLDLIIQEDLKTGSLQIPGPKDAAAAEQPKEPERAEA